MIRFSIVGISLLWACATFALADGSGATISPTSGRFGTPVSITLASPSSLCEFNDTTVVSWTGVYTSPLGSATTPFTISWPVAEVDVQGPGSAVIVIGGGASLDAPNVDAFKGLGAFTGTATIITLINRICPWDLNGDSTVNGADMAILLANWGPCDPPAPALCPGDINNDGQVNGVDLAALLLNFTDCPVPVSFEVAKPMNFSLTSDATEWRTVFYPDGPGGLDPPELGMTRPDVDMFLVSQLPNLPPAVDTMMMAANSFHMIAVVLVEENAQSLLSAPATIIVDLVSLTATGAELDRISNVMLTRIDNDQDPTNITYRSDLMQPVMMVDTVLDPLMYPGLMLLRGVTDGYAVVAPSFTN